MTEEFLRIIPVQEIARATRQAVDGPTLDQAGSIIAQVRRDSDKALAELGQEFNDLGPDGQLVFTATDLQKALDRLPRRQQDLLKRTAARIQSFAQAQRQIFQDQTIPIQGGQAGWRFHAVQRAGCYAPGGRFPLPSSVLMTAVTARAAGVPEVWVASPSPGDLILAAAAVGGADNLLAAGGAQAIAAMAYGTDRIPPCDVVVGPGNRFVTAAKQLVSGQVGIDMLAGPSELLILADEAACPATIAADLLAQAEHDPDAVPLLITTAAKLIPAVNTQLNSQLVDLPTASLARQALANGGAVLVSDLAEGIKVCESLAPEHLELMVGDLQKVAARLTRFGALFLGERTAEVLGDYGAGPNHVLPTGGTARFTGGLSVQNFLVGRTWLQMESGTGANAIAEDAVALARLEGLEAHARSAARRMD